LGTGGWLAYHDKWPLARWLEELDGIAVGILELSLSAPRTAFFLIAEPHSSLLQHLDRPLEVRYA
jgi:hypothetical protein